MTTPSTEIPAQYDPAATEREWYIRWEEAGAFTANPERSRRLDDDGGGRTPFTIVMPPPNVTAVLHMGHGLNDTVQDVIIRWRRMVGDETLWLPGTDHAGIATQNVVEKQLAQEHLTRFDVGRDAFVQRTTEFVQRTGGTILQQLRAIGASCDWTRTAYTLSPQLSAAVREAFVQLYERGLIYRGHRVIHWCPRCLTSLSDEEAEHSEEAGALYHISYPLQDDPSRSVTVATTRPETLLGDVAVAVNPEDERYRDIIGKMLMLPIANVPIPVIADSYADPEFGTGVVKITPAHDPNDFEVGRRHALAMPVVIAPDGRMDNVAEAGERVPPELRNVDRFEARERIVAMLKHLNRLVRIEPHQHAVRHCYRCDTVVEPRLSDQWFVKMAALAAPALDAVRTGRVKILPERWEGVYVHWLENIRDWNISRQLWWGHRIPVWYCINHGCVTVSRTDVIACPNCHGPVRQDEDVLDTWFSSWLWPFSTLGWPNTDAADLRAFYPTDDLITAPEILFFWVARMIMAGYAFMGEAPFHTVYLHGTVRDTNHVKMSKSLGNGIDPLDVVRLYGADALRYTVISGMGMGADLTLDPNDLDKSFSPGRNFATKLWNIGRFLLTNIGDEAVASIESIDHAAYTRADSWILDRLRIVIIECNDALSAMRLNEYAEAARRFVWNELADWYVETTKGRLNTPGVDRDVARTVLVHSFDSALRLLHPIVPFITEALWQRLPNRIEGDSAMLCTANWPYVTHTAPLLTNGPAEFECVRDAVNAIRAIRAEYTVPPGKVIDIIINESVDLSELEGHIPAHSTRHIYSEEATLIGRLARVNVRSSSNADAFTDRAGAAHALLPNGGEIVVPLGGLVDVAKECAKLRTELGQLETQLAALTQRLANPGFTTRAPAHVVDAERAKEGEWTIRRDQIRAKIADLCDA
jgi:valyl-tRNA synthetase